MIESDQSDKETQDKAPSLEVSDDSVGINEPAQKRLRDETSEDEKMQLPSKKPCMPVNATTSEKHETTSIHEVNGTVKDANEDAKSISASDNKEDVEKTSTPEESTNIDIKEAHDTKSNSENDEEARTTNNTAIEKKDGTQDSTDEEQQKDSTSPELVTNVDEEETTVTDKEMEKEEDNIKRKNKRSKTQIEDAEVVEGLELSVECASDKESSSSSDSEPEQDVKPKPKTIIVKAKPNDSELDVSSSEAEKSDSQETSEVKFKQTTKKGKKSGRASFGKAKTTDSEENDNVSDEDYSPQTKRKLKKPTSKMTAKSSMESQRGRGRAKKGTQKSIEQEDEEEDENSVTAEDKKVEESLSDVESLKSKSDDDSDSENTSKDVGKRRRSTRSEDDKSIQVLKKYIRVAGIRVKSYNDLWVGCKSNAAKRRCLKELLEKNGISGRPSLEKCKKAKERNERLKDVAELNTSNIISEGRVTRAQRSKDSSSKEVTKTSETPTKHHGGRSTFKRVFSVIDSDSD